jgi:hypothetical protein
MDHSDERRQEQRLDYRWPVWFSEDFAETMTQGLMVDISSGGIAFDCDPGEARHPEGWHLTVRFSIPRFEGDDPTATVSITRTGHVCRAQQVEGGLWRVTVQFETPLPLRPAEVSSLGALCGRGDGSP